jgi:hypothetical protein
MIAEEMDDMKKAHDRDRKVYMRQIEEWYEKKKVDWFANNVTEAHTAAEKAKIRAYRRKQGEDERKEEAKEAEIKYENMEEKRVEQWLKVWGKKAEEEAEKVRMGGYQKRNASTFH